MLEKSFGLLFFLRKPSPFRKGPWLVMLRITVDSVDKELSLKRLWNKKDWRKKPGRAIGSSMQARELNSYLDIITAKVYQAKRMLLETSKAVTATAIRDMVSGAAERKRMLFKIYEDHNAKVKSLIGKGYSDAYWAKHNLILGYLKTFLQGQYGMNDININSVDLAFGKAFYDWLRIERGIGHNTTVKYISMFKKIILECKDNGWILIDPFAKMDLVPDDVDPTYLKKEELEAMAQKKMPSQRLEVIRDIYIFCCLTSLAYIDVKQLKRSEVTIGVDGDLWIDKKRQKSKVPSRVPLLPLTKQILEKYKNHPGCVASDKLLPVSSNSKYNDYLKEIAAICGIEKNLTTHSARHTFGTTVTRGNGVPLDSVQSMMGHKRREQTEHYARILPEQVAEDMQVLNKKLSDKKFLKDYADSLPKSETES